ncbi:VCBS domain-containing protein, partial [Algibacillus agarilyticus]|uniref:VCBS domain-containing protein n=1 Tax=Algibacillus agarilyticus TaxID=2234133 RepID=UPI0013009E61
YTPNSNYTGNDSFTYTVTDAGSGESLTQTVSVTVAAVTDLTAADDSFNATEDTVLNGSVAGNDSTTSGGTLSFAKASDPSHGTVTVNTDGTFSYTPNSNYTGSDSFTYTVTDADSGESLTQTVSVTVAAVTDLTAADDSFNATEDTVLNGSVAGNDSTTSGGTLSFVKASDPSHGTVTVNTDGTFSYTPNSNYTGNDSFTYTVTDADSGESLTQTVNVNVSAVNDAAVIAGDDTGAVTEDASTPNLTDTGTLTISDADTGEATFDTSSVVKAAGTLGDLTITEAGEWSYSVANANVQYLGAGKTKTETFTVKAADGTEHTVDVVITGVNDAAVIAGDDTGAVTEDASTPNLTDTGTLTISDADTGEATFDTSSVVKAAGTLGDLTITEAGEWSYSVANANVQYLGAGKTKTETFTVKAADGTEHTVNVVITGVNDASDITVGSGDSDTGAVTEDISVNSGKLSSTGSLSISDADSGDSPAFNTNGTFKAVGSTNGTALGKLTITSGGEWSYEVDNTKVQYLDNGDTVTEIYTVTATDGTTHDVTITINGTDDSASVIASSSTVAEAGLTSAGDTSETATGSFTVSASDGVASINVGGTDVSLAELNALSGTPQVINTGEGNITLTDYAADTGVVSYSYTLSAAQTHDKNTNDTSITDSIALSVTGAGGSTGTGTLAIAITDDTPTITITQPDTLTFTDQTINVVIMLDSSGSMDDDMDGNTPSSGEKSRIQIAQESINKMLDAYENLGNVNVKLIEFDATATDRGWMTTEAGKTAVNAVTPGGWTDYDDALKALVDDGQLSNSSNSDVAGANLTKVYFVSDGVPKEGSSGTEAQDQITAYQQTWLNYINNSNDDAIADDKVGSLSVEVIGIGNSVSNQYLNMVAQPDANNSSGNSSDPAVNNSQIVTTADAMLTALLSSVELASQGSVGTLNGSGSIYYGADTDGALIESVVIGSTTYTPSDATDNEVVINTDNGGELTFNFSTGDYQYQIDLSAVEKGKDASNASSWDKSNDTKWVLTESLTVNIKDGDGDPASDTLILKTEFPLSSYDLTAVANVDTASITESDGDTPANPSDAEVSGNVVTNDHIGFDVTEPVTGVIAGSGSVGNAGVSQAVVGSYGSVVINADGSYTYTLDNANTSVQQLKNGETLTEIFTYKVEDNSGDTSTAQLQITINGLNDSININDDTATLAANSTNGTAVYDVNESNTGNDKDTDGDALSYQLTSHTDIFTIDSGTGEITVLDSSKLMAGTYNLNVNTSDTNNFVSDIDDSATITITVTNTNPDAVDDPEGYDLSQGSVGGSNLNWNDVTITAVDAGSNSEDGNIVYYSGYKVGIKGDGVAGGPDEQIQYNTLTNKSEQLIINLDSAANTGTFSVANMYADEGGSGSHEQGKWTAYMDDVKVGSDTFYNATGNTGSFTIDTNDLAFNKLVFEAVELTAGQRADSDDSSDYFLSNLQVSASTNYAVNQSSSTGFKIAFADLLDNDTDIDGDSLTITGVSNPSSGTVEINGSNEVIFKPVATSTGIQTFQYTISDGKGGTDTATVSVYVNVVESSAERLLSGRNFYIGSSDADDSLTLDVAGYDVYVTLGGAATGTTNDLSDVSTNGTITTIHDNWGTAGQPVFGIQFDDDTKGLYVAGGAGYDHLTGTDKSDVLIGGANGHGTSGATQGGREGDLLTGGDGQDIFLWTEGDEVDTGDTNNQNTLQLAEDFITDFTLGNTDDSAVAGADTSAFNANADILDLADLLEGVTEDADNLDKYLNFTKDGDDTVISVSINGNFTEDSSDDNKTEMKIRLEDVDLTNYGGTDAEIITRLLNDNQLNTDNS